VTVKEGKKHFEKYPKSIQKVSQKSESLD